MSSSFQAGKQTTDAAKPRKRFVGSKHAKPSKPGVKSLVSNQVPEDILKNDQLNAAIQQLPSNYSFEIHKTIYHIRKNNATMVALQMPEGLLMFACTIADIIERFTKAQTVIMGDVTYGACCIDDFTALALGCDMMVHYGHSCLVPVDQTSIKTLYVFVEIGIDFSHLHQTIRLNFPNDRHLFRRRLLDPDEENRHIPIGTIIASGTAQLRIEASLHSSEDGDASLPSEPTRLALVSTIQFVAALQKLKEDLSAEYGEDHFSCETSAASLWTGRYEAIIPRAKPLSPGEILGCTAPVLNDVDAIIYLGDGRFHLESIMIANPTIPAFRYDPYSKKLTREIYNHTEMQLSRDQAVQAARRNIALNENALATMGEHLDDRPLWGVILGTLGRQGNFNQMQAITRQLTTPKRALPHMQILLSELSPAKLALFNPHISIFVQTSCPRLSIDWGYAFDRPLLSPYEVAVAVGKVPSWRERQSGNSGDGVYPMNFYEAGTPWATARITSSL